MNGDRETDAEGVSLPRGEILDAANVVKEIRFKVDRLLFIAPGEESLEGLEKKTGIDECLKLREELAGKDLEGHREILERKLWLETERDRLMSDEYRLNEEDVANLEKLEEALKNNPGMGRAICNELLNLNMKIPKALGVEDPINNALHVIRVSQTTSEWGGPIEGIMGALHDVVKLVSRDGKDMALLAEHEVLSARAAQMIVEECEEIFDKIGGVGCGKSLAKLTAKTFYHGRREYLELMTIRGGVFVGDKSWVKKGILYGGLYTGSPDLEGLNLGAGVEGRPGEMLNNLRAADMLDGCTGFSFLKYLEFYPAKAMVAEGKLHKFVTNRLFASFETNLAFAPDCPVKKEFLKSDKYLKALMIYILLSDDPGVGGELGDELKEITGKAPAFDTGREEKMVDGGPYEINTKYINLMVEFETMLLGGGDGQSSKDKFVKIFDDFLTFVNRLDINQVPNLRNFLEGKGNGKINERIGLMRKSFVAD